MVAIKKAGKASAFLLLVILIELKNYMLYCKWLIKEFYNMYTYVKFIMNGLLQL